MALSPEQRDGLRYWLETLLDDELDCDRFTAFLAAHIDGAIEDPLLRSLMDLHSTLCPECHEEHQTLLKALDR